MHRLIFREPFIVIQPDVFTMIHWPLHRMQYSMVLRVQHGSVRKTKYHGVLTAVLMAQRIHMSMRL